MSHIPERERERHRERERDTERDRERKRASGKWKDMGVRGACPNLKSLIVGPTTLGIAAFGPLKRLKTSNLVYVHMT